MKKILLVTSIAVLLSACATKVEIKEEFDVEPDLVGLSLDKKIEKSNERIKNQEALLTQIRTGKTTAFEVIQHNNGLDARINSKNTIPESYAFKDKFEQQRKAEELKMVEINRLKGILNTNIKNIEWRNDSANELGRMFAKVLGYTFVESSKNVKITLIASNISVKDALDKYIKLVAAYDGSVSIDKEQRTFAITYK